MMKSRLAVPKYLYFMLLLYCGASLLHFVHNAEFIADYPNLPEWLTRSKVYLAWLAITMLGAAGVIALHYGFRLFGLLLVAGYAALGFAGLDHYWVAPILAHSLAMNATIWFEVAAAAALLAGVLRQLVVSQSMVSQNDAAGSES